MMYTAKSFSFIFLFYEDPGPILDEARKRAGMTKMNIRRKTGKIYFEKIINPATRYRKPSSSPVGDRTA
jgi:hypothetical protein